MSMCAIFELECCRRLIVHGRFRGNTMYPPSMQRCPFGCPEKCTPAGKPDRIGLKFVTHKNEKSAIEPRVWKGQLVPAAEAIERGLV